MTNPGFLQFTGKAEDEDEPVHRELCEEDRNLLDIVSVISWLYHPDFVKA